MIREMTASISSFDILWIRIVDNIGSAIGFLLIGIILAWLMTHWKTVGHRTLLSVGSIFCGVHSFVSFVAAVDLYAGTQTASIVGRSVTALLGLYFAVHVFVCRDDLLRTLSTSEAENIRRLDRIIDQEHARLLLQYADVQTRAASERLLIYPEVRNNA